MNDQDKILDGMAKSHPRLQRGQVWCTKCGKSRRVDVNKCIGSGWPRCCGQTMTIDSPDERQAGDPDAAG